MIEPLPPTGLDIEQSIEDGHGLLSLRGELDIASVPTLEAAVTRLCSEDRTAITLDLSRLVFIDSTGLAGKLCEKNGFEFSLVQGPSAVRRLFELTGLIDLLPFQREDEVHGAEEGLSQV
jgi:anti-anti-sigma factor